MHFMNRQRQGHMAGKATDYTDRTQSPAAGAPAAGGDPGAGDVTVTLTKGADGSITCDTGDGNPQPYGSVDEALEAAKMTLGPDDDQGEGDQGGDGRGAQGPGAGGMDLDD